MTSLFRQLCLANNMQLTILTKNKTKDPKQYTLCFRAETQPYMSVYFGYQIFTIINRGNEPICWPERIK